MRLAILSLLCALAAPAWSSDNPRLKELFLADQQARAAEPDTGDLLTATPREAR